MWGSLEESLQYMLAIYLHYQTIIEIVHVKVSMPEYKSLHLKYPSFELGRVPEISEIS
jgi:hypothetical protein